MTTLHAIYRVDDQGTPAEQWSAYSYPVSIYVGGRTLEEARAEFRDAAELTPDVLLVEHIERPLIPGAYIRIAVDRRMPDREEATSRMLGSLQVEAQRRDFEASVPLSATGDAVMIACVADDKLGWIFDQMDDHDAVGICAAGPSVGASHLVWWSYLVGEDAHVRSDLRQDRLSDLGLSRDSTVGELARLNDSPHRRALVAIPA